MKTVAFPMRYQLEVAIETVEDAHAAEAGGADRVELSSALDLGGLTPSLGLYREVRSETKLPVWVMIRPRPGGYAYEERELRVMTRDIALYRGDSPAGFVLGVLHEDDTINMAWAGRLLELANGVPCVFHRAFDSVLDPVMSANELARLGYQRILTSGGENTAIAGAAQLAKLQRAVGSKIEILPCGRVRSDNVRTVLEVTKCLQVHGSFATIASEPMRQSYRRSQVSQKEVAATRVVLDQMAAIGVTS